MRFNSAVEDIVYYLKLKKPKRVLVTGFGPFEGYDTNPSMEAVKAMDTRNMNNVHKIKLMKEKIEVRYVDVDLTVSKLLEVKQPDMTIHVGVSDVKCLRLEARANKYDYERPDRDFRYAARFQNPAPGPNFIDTRFDVTAIRDEFNDEDCRKDDLQMEISYEFVPKVELQEEICCKYPSKDNLQAEISMDAGRFLCEYIYYTSLSLDRCPTLFVHVPHVKDDSLKDEKFKQLARGLERIVELCLKQLTKVSDKKSIVK